MSCTLCLAASDLRIACVCRLSPSRLDSSALLDGSYVVIDSHELLREYRETQGTPPVQDKTDPPGSQVKDSIAAVRMMMAAAADGGDIGAVLVRQNVEKQQEEEATAAEAAR